MAALPGEAAAEIFGAVLPASRAVAVNTSASAFATIINAGNSTVQGCSLGLPNGIPATFGYQTTDPATNQVTGSPNTPVNIPAGASQSFVFSVRPTASFPQTNIAIKMSCTSGETVASITGVNTFLLTSSTGATPDVVALAATISNDGVVRTPGTAATGAFSVATVNVGAGGPVTASVDTGGVSLPATFTICQTNAQAQCLQNPAGSVQASFAANQTGTFSIFVTSTGSVIALDPAHFRVFVRFAFNTGSVGATSVAVQTQITLGTGGGSLQLGPVNVQAGTGTTVVPTDFSATPVPDPAPMPPGETSLNSSYNIGASNNTGLFNNGLNGPVYMTVPYGGLGVSNPSRLQVLHFDSASGRYEPTTLQNIDTNAQTISFDSRNFSIFSLVTNTGSDPASFTTTSGGTPFTPAVDGFQSINFGGYLSPGGNCLGMSTFTRWFWRYRFPQTLFGHYPVNTPQPYSVEQLVAIRAHINQSAYWNALYSRQNFLFFGQLLAYQQNHPDQMVALLKHNLSVFDDPVVTIIGTPQAPNAHAILAYAYDANNIYFYDPNCPKNNCSVNANGVIAVPYTAAGIAAYTGPALSGIGVPTVYSIIGNPSTGGPDSLGQIASEGDGGFAASANLSVTSPQQNATVSSYQTELAGSLGGNLNQSSQVAYWLNGLYNFGTAAVSGGSFDTTINASGGLNTLVVLAGLTAYNGQLDSTLANSAVVVRQFNGPVDTIFRATLTWFQPNTDLDLYVTEPAPSGQTAWFANHATSNGLNLDFDNTSGFGPENTTIPTGSTALAGSYVVKVHYYSDHGTGQATNGNVVITLYEHNALKYKQKTFNWAIGISGAQGQSCCNDSPGSVGADWFLIDNVDVAGDNIP